MGWVSSESFRGADGCFRAHRVGLKDVLKSFRPIGWGSKIDGNPSGLMGWVSSESFRGADGCFRAHRVGLKDFKILQAHWVGLGDWEILQAS